MSEDDDQEFSDEVEVDLDDRAEPRAEAPEEGDEFLGEYASVEDYFAGMLGELMHPEIVWVLECVDFAEVRRRFEADGSRYFRVAGAVYRRG